MKNGATVDVLPAANDAELDAMAIEDLEDHITSFAGRIAAATATWLVWIAAFDRREGWRRWEQQSCAAWLNWKCGVDLRTAHEHVRVARSLESLPVLRELFLAGEVSYSKARAISRVANEYNEQELCDVALVMTASQLEATCGALRRRDPIPAWSPNIIFESMGDHGRIIIELPIDDYHRARNSVYGAADGLIEEQHARTGSECSMAETVADMGGLGSVRVEAAGAILDGTLDATEGPFEDAMLVVDNDALASTREDAENHEGTCTHADEWIPPIIARRIACDARLQVAVEDAVGEALGQGREQRVVNRRLRRLLRRRDHGMCQFPGCGTRRRLHAHHVIHWEHGGPTELENLISLCHRHHRSVHEGGWNIIDKNGRFVFYDPQGHERHVPRLADPTPGVLLAEPTPLRLRPETRAPLSGLGQRTDVRWIADNISANTRLARDRAEDAESAFRGTQSERHPRATLG